MKVNEKFKKDLVTLFNDSLNDLEREKLPPGPKFFGQIRTNGVFNQGSVGKFMFQWYGGMEAQFYASGKFTEIVDVMSIVGRKGAISWHSNQPYTPVIFWPEAPNSNAVTLLLWFMHTDGTVKPRAIKVKLTANFAPYDEYIKQEKTNGINPKTLDEKSDDD